jgi:hypothetical protein
MEQTDKWRPLKSLAAVLLIGVIFILLSTIKPLFGLVVLCIAFYFAPTMFACSSKKRNTTAIFILNVFTGWTVIGWIIALVWSFTVDAKLQL